MGRLGEIFRAHGADYRKRFGERMSVDQLRAMRALERCHTPAAGGVLWRCSASDCDCRHFTFRGCGNRHCPACGQTHAQEWLRKQCALLLPGVTYHLVTFTVPKRLRRPIRSHPRQLLELLMRSASSTLMDLCKNPQWVGGMPGATAVLHTWTRQYQYHPHVHFIVTGGALDPTGQWRNAHERFLVPVPALSSVFRARFRDALREAHPTIFAQLAASVWQEHEWVVHSKPVGSGQRAYGYLARYLYRVALTERAILQHTDEQIVLRYRHSKTNQPRTLRLGPHEFLRRFLQHVLPSRFCKLRHYGLHHSSKRPTIRLLQALFELLGHGPTPPSAPEKITGPVPSCPRCQAPMILVRHLNATETQACFAPLPGPQARGPP